MSDIDKIVVSCKSWEDIGAAVSEAKRALPLETKKRLTKIFSSYLVRYDLEGVYERMNNRTVAQIFAEYQPEDLPEVASGEVGGVKYHLYEAPPRRVSDGDGSNQP